MWLLWFMLVVTHMMYKQHNFNQKNIKIKIITCMYMHYVAIYHLIKLWEIITKDILLHFCSLGAAL